MASLNNIKGGIIQGEDGDDAHNRTMTAAAVVTQVGNGTSSTTSSIVPIDYQQLYKDERRKMKEERLLLMLQKQIQRHPEARGNRGSTISSTSTTTNTSINDHTSSTHKSSVSLMEHNQQLKYPEWNFPLVNDDFNMPIENDDYKLPRPTLTTYKEDMIHYQQDYLSSKSNDQKYCNALIEWLHRLPTNSNISNHNPSKSTTNSLNHANGKWTFLPYAQRRVALFDISGNTSDGSNNTSATHSFPTPLQILVNSIKHLFPIDKVPNHILINEYPYSYSGILPHTDGPSYYHQTITISLVQDCDVIFHFIPISQNTQTTNYITDGSHKYNDIDDTTSNDGTKNPIQMILHGNGSIIVFEKEAYTNYYHTIHDLSSQTDVDRNDSNNSATGGQNKKARDLPCNNTMASSSSSSMTLQSVIDNDDDCRMIEYTTKYCLNYSVPNTPIVRSPNRISITIRHKYSF